MPWARRQGQTWRKHALDAGTSCPAHLHLLHSQPITCRPLPNPFRQTSEFQATSKRLPIALRDWLAYKDCRRAIDDFLEQLPLFQALAHMAVRNR